jgi:hypothetical protein
MTTSPNYVSQLPGELNLEMVDDNDLVFTIDWGMDITDYTFTANIIPDKCESEIPMVVSIISASAGKMNVTIQMASIVDIAPSTNKWYMNWTTSASLVRTVLAGVLALRAK